MSTRQKTTQVWAMRTLGQVYLFPLSHKPSPPTWGKHWYTGLKEKRISQKDATSRLFSFCSRQFRQFCPVLLPLDTPVRISIRLSFTVPEDK